MTPRREDSTDAAATTEPIAGDAPRAEEAHVADVAIVGAGPAGSALAIHLARSRTRVALIDRAAPAFRVGETLPPSVTARLRRLGVWPAFQRLRPLALHGVLSAWGDGAPGAHSYFGHPDTNGWQVDRSAFDDALRGEAVAAGARLLSDVGVQAVERSSDDRWLVRARGEAGSITVRAPLVVDATGRRAAVAGRLGARRQSLDRMVGITLVFSRSGGPAPTLVEATPLGWWYTTTVPGDRTVAVLMTDGDLCAQHRLGQPGSWRSALAAAPLTRERLCAERLLSGPLAHAAATHTLDPPSGDGWLAVGDAAAGRDPISGSGVDFALASAELAAIAIESRRQGDHRALGTYGELVRRDFAAYRAERRGYYAAEQRWPDSVFWRRRREMGIEAVASIATRSASR